MIFFVSFILNPFKEWSSWKSLSRLGNNKIYSTSYIWVIFVPIISKLIEFINKIEGKSDISFLSFISFSEIHLPFSWEVFFYSALSFSFANTIYHIFCPEYIKLYNSFDEFKNTGQDWDQLRMHLIEFYDIKENGTKQNGIDVMLNFGKKFSCKNTYFESGTPDERYESIQKGIMRITMTSDDLRSCFWFIKDHQNKSRYFARYLCSISYLIGYFLIFWIIIQNTSHVFRVSDIFR